MKLRNWFLVLPAIYLVISAFRSLFAEHPSLLRPPLNEAELGI